MSKEDAQLKEFLERKKKEFNIGSLLNSKAVSQLKKWQLASKQVLEKKSAEITSSKDLDDDIQTI